MGFPYTDNADPALPGIVETAYGLYPGLDAFSGEYDAQDYCDWVEQSNGDPLPAPLAVYIRDSGRDTAEPVGSDGVIPAAVPRAIEQEVRLQGALFDADRPVQQLICTGNIAAAWTDDQLYALVSAIQASFTLGQAQTGWCACLGATGISEARLRLLQVLGFLKIRFALYQDDVRDAATSHRALENIEALAGLARRLGMRQIMVDLFYSATANALTPARLESFVHNVRPELVRLVEKKPEALSGARASQRDGYADRLATLDYENIGLDWFVCPGDQRRRPALSRQLHWSVLGYTDMPSPDVVGIGPGAVSTIGEFYSRNEHRWQAYTSLVNQNLIPTVRGLELESDDSLRREIMTMMLTDACIDIRAIEDKWGIHFDQFFSPEINQLSRFQKAGSVIIETDSIRILARGRRELRELCEAFDRRIRLAASGNAPSFA
ncbi:MAG: hypothetical protein J5I92_00540 [Thiogranum sp.]|nr:hypothetical protein [Thiogranum sp.]